MDALSVGDIAPDFCLLNTDREEVCLHKYQNSNPVVLLFFPLAFTSVCTKELCLVRDHLQDYKQLDAFVFGISVDSHFTLAKFKEDQKLNFDLLSDFNKKVSFSYGAFYDDFFGMNGVSKRAAFVIDRKGIIKYAEVLDDASNVPDFHNVLEALRAT